jgi:hypothetical protein
MGEGMGAIVSSTSYIAADETDPEVDIRVAYAAFSVFVIKWKALACLAEVVLRVATYGTPTTLPLLEARTMEDVLANDSEQAGGLVHPFQANGARR